MLCWTVHLRGVLTRPFPASVAVGHELYCFGGDIYKRDQIDVHVFNTVSLRWKLPPVATEVGERPADVPSLRSHHTAVLIEGAVYVWGGELYPSCESCNVLYAFDVDTHRWSKPEVSGAAPEGRSGHSACVLGKVMYIHGGKTQLTGYTNDIYTLNTATMVWSLINTRGTPAPATSCHSATIIGTEMFVFGGSGDLYNGMRVFDTETNRWLSKSSAQLPNTRCPNFAYNGELYMFGGINWYHNSYDLRKFNPQTFSWTKVEPKGKGPYSKWHDIYSFVVGDRVVVFGRQNRLYDLFILDLSTGLKALSKLAVIQCGLEQSELPHNIRWELAAMTTNSEIPWISWKTITQISPSH